MSEPMKSDPMKYLSRSKYELKDTAAEKYWRKCFHNLEQNAFQVNHKRGSVVYNVINNNHIFELVAPILGVDDPRDRVKRRESDQAADEEENELRIRREKSEDKNSSSEEDSDDESDEDSDNQNEDANGKFQDQYQEKDQWQLKHDVIHQKDIKNVIDDHGEAIEGGETGVRKTSVNLMEEIAEEEDGAKQDKDTKSLSEESDVSSLNVEPPTYHGDDVESYEPYSNPYLTFMKKSKACATDAWRPRPRPKPTAVYEPDPNLSLTEKSATITNSITTEFCTWLRSLGGEQSAMNEEVLNELFKIGFDKPASRALVNRIKEMPTLSTSLAKARDIEEADYRVVIRAELEKDMEAERRKPRTEAFGRTLTYPDRFEPPTNNVNATWLGAKPPDDLATFTTVWDGILHLKSTTGFCGYLKKNPQLRRPPFLQKAGMFSKPRFAKKSRKSKNTSLLYKNQAPSSPDLADMGLSARTSFEYTVPTFQSTSKMSSATQLSTQGLKKLSSIPLRSPKRTSVSGITILETNTSTLTTERRQSAEVHSRKISQLSTNVITEETAGENTNPVTEETAGENTNPVPDEE